MATYLIVPAMTDQAGQCRIVRHPGRKACALADYRLRPDEWSEAGLMNSSGKLVCLDAPAELHEEMKGDEPLAAGLIYYSED